MGKMVVYLSGPITGVEGYREAFDKAESELKATGYIVLNPAKLPEGMTKEQYMQINLAQIDAADVVWFLHGWQNSEGAKLEHSYCEYIGKAVIEDD